MHETAHFAKVKIFSLNQTIGFSDRRRQSGVHVVYRKVPPTVAAEDEPALGWRLEPSLERPANEIEIRHQRCDYSDRLRCAPRQWRSEQK